MYLVYMDCVARIEAGDRVEDMWRGVLRNQIVKNPDDVETFFRSVTTLTSPSADAWWDTFKELLDNDFKGRLADVRTRIDQLQTDTADLRKKLLALEAIIQSLTDDFDKYKESTLEQDVLLWKNLKKLQDRIELLEDTRNVVKESIQVRGES